MTSTIKGALRIAACALVFATVGSDAAQVSVQLDTGAYSGAGYLDLQFNPGANGTAPASAILSGFSGALGTGDAETTGAVTGALPGTVGFLNASPYNDLFQPLTLGGLFSLLLDFDGYLAEGFASGSVFAVSLYGADGMRALGNADPFTGALATIELAPASLGGLSIDLADSALASASVQPDGARPVPEPGSMLMLLSGLGLIWIARRRQSGA